MAAPMDHHRRSKSCDDRPAYRDGRREKAVKVYTVNLESRYLLVQGVPDIKVTQELLKLFSLYGTIEEYRILEDYPSEEFTQVYWVKYASIQAARVAKRKMDDHSFYGGILHVSYAPEYESVDDTRRKLQERRKDVAKRLRKLQQGSRAEASVSTGHVSSATSTTITDDNLCALESSTKTPIGQDATSNQVIGPREPASTFPDNTVTDPHQSVNDSSDAPAGDDGDVIPQQLPEPPRALPAWKWEEAVTSRDQYPRLPTAHATLPRNFNPYPDGYEPHRHVTSREESKSQSSASSDVTLTDPLTDPAREPAARRDAFDFGKAGARPKFKLRQDRRLGGDSDKRANQPPRSKFLERMAWRNNDDDRGRSSGSESKHGAEASIDRRPRPQTLKRPHPNPDPSSSGASIGAPPDQQRSSLMPRQLLGKRRPQGPSSQPGQSGFGLGPGARGGQTDGRIETSHATSSAARTPSETGEASFDRTIQSIRHRMRNVAQVPGNLSDDVRPAQQVHQQPAARPAAAAAAAPAAGGEPATKRLRI